MIAKEFAGLSAVAPRRCLFFALPGTLSPANFRNRSAVEGRAEGRGWKSEGGSETRSRIRWAWILRERSATVQMETGQPSSDSGAAGEMPVLRFCFVPVFIRPFRLPSFSELLIARVSNYAECSRAG